jgi:hypothetical protein
MRQLKWAVLVVLLGLVPQLAQAQRDGRTERRIARLMDDLRSDMWSYRQELDFFRRAPEYEQLVDLRYRIRGLAIRVAELEGRPGASRSQREMAREMEEAARDLQRLTARLEQRTDIAAPREVRRRADMLKVQADRIRETIDRLSDLVR